MEATLQQPATKRFACGLDHRRMLAKVEDWLVENGVPIRPTARAPIETQSEWNERIKEAINKADVVLTVYFDAQTVEYVATVEPNPNA